MGTIELKSAQKRRNKAVQAFGELVVKKDRILSMRNNTVERAVQLAEILKQMTYYDGLANEATRDIEIARDGIALSTEANKHQVARENANPSARAQGRL